MVSRSRILILDLPFTLENTNSIFRSTVHPQFIVWFPSGFCFFSNSASQCATGNPVPVPVDPVDFFISGSGPVPAKYRPDRPDLTSKFGCRI